MCPRRHRDFTADRTQILVTAPVHSLLLFQNADTEGLFLDIIECLRDREIVRLWVFFQDRCFYFFAKGVDRFRPRNLALRIKRSLDPIARHLICNLQQFWFYTPEWHLAFGLSGLR